MAQQDAYTILVHPGMAAPAIEARVTVPDEPGTYGGSANRGALDMAYFQLGYGDQWGEQRVASEDVALTYSAVWAAVRFIAQSLAAMPWHVYERSADGRSKLPIEDNIAWTLQMQANPEVSAFDWRQAMLKDALLWGNGYAEIERYGSGAPAWLWRLSPDRVQPVRDEAGQLWYEVTNPVGAPQRCTYLHPSNVFHLKGLGPDGLIGYSVISMARRAIQLGLQEEEFGSAVFGKGPMPGGILEIPGKLTKDQRTEYRQTFQSAYSGRANQGRVIVLDGGSKFTPANLPNDDAQFLESRQFQVTEIARWYGVPPHKIGDLSRSTNNNIEEQGREAVADCLRPWACRLESEGDIKLYGRTARGRRFTCLDLDAIQRGNSQSQTDTITRQVAGGLRTPNEGREYLGMNPQENGDDLLVQGAMTTLDRVVSGENFPSPAAGQDGAGASAPADPKTDQSQTADAVRRVFGSLLADAYARLLRVDHDKAKRAHNKGRLAEHVAEYYEGEEPVQRVAAMLRPVFEGALLAAGRVRDDAERLARLAAERHVARCVADLTASGADALALCQARGDDAAREDMKGVVP